MKVDVIITHWLRNIERLAYFIITVESMKEKLRWHGVEHQYHVCTESPAHSDRQLWDSFRYFCEKHDMLVHVKQTGPSLSSMLNFAQGVGDSEILMFNQDDFMAIEPLNMAKYAERLMSHDDEYVVRLRWRDELHQGGRQIPNTDLWEVLPEIHGYLFTDNPHLRKRSYIEQIGGWDDSIAPDGTDQGRCENSQNAKAKAFARKLKVLSIDRQAFRHIGSPNTTLVDKRFNR